MLVDRRKDNYDELLVLARDSRVSRSRTNRWTTGIVITAMAATGAYVAAMSQQVDELRQAKDTADDEAFRLSIELARMQGEYAALLAEKEAYKKNAEWFVSLAPDLSVDDLVTQISNEFGERPAIGNRPGPQQAPTFALSNFVWYVDGSRRFPMTVNDILWIPEGRFWVRLEQGDMVSVHSGPEAPEAGDTAPAFPMNIPGSYYERSAVRGTANCVRLELDDRTLREFGPDYVDMIVTWTTNQDCAGGFVEPD